MNPEKLKILNYVLKLHFYVLILSNGMRPIELKFKELNALKEKKYLTIRISIDHYTKFEHEKIRGKNNINWMNILRIAIKNSPEETKNLKLKINNQDNKISTLLKK